MMDDQLMTDNMLAAEGVGERRASFLEMDPMVYTNGTIGRIMSDTQDLTVQSGTMTTIKDDERYGIGLIENSELVELRGIDSISTLDLIHGALDVVGNEYTLRSTDSLSQDESKTSVGRKVRRYSRLELEALRFVDTDKQQQKWGEIYKGLETVISKEYDEISTNNQDKTNRNYDKWQQPNKKSPTNFKRVVHVEDNSKVADAMDMYGYGSDADEESWTAKGEEYEDDSDEEYASIQRPAFLVDGEPDFESGSPQDGLEYLRRVRWEAAQMPKVKVAKFDAAKWSSEQTSYMPNIPEIAKCPETLSPSKHWVNAFLADFSEFRKDFTEFEGSTNRAYCVPTDVESNPGPRMGKNVPTVSTIVDMDCVSRAATLRNRIKALEAACSLSRDDCLWIFALCVAVDTPFDAEMSSCIRCLLRKCSSLLAKKSEYDEEAAMLHILIVISGKYFGQSEN